MPVEQIGRYIGKFEGEGVKLLKILPTDRSKNTADMEEGVSKCWKKLPTSFMDGSLCSKRRKRRGRPPLG